MAERRPLRGSDQDVLIVVDVQYDFLPGGSLAVPGGHAVIGPINRLGRAFPHCVLTQDWHPPGHASFASSHPGKSPFETVELPYGTQILWPDHCIQGTRGSEIASDIEIAAEVIIRKGHNPAIDSYSGFMEADRATRTGLAGYLAERGFRRIFCAGLAFDFCVAWTALDARRAGFETFVVEDATCGIDANGSVARARGEMQAAGVRLVTTDEVLGG